MAKRKLVEEQDIGDQPYRFGEGSKGGIVCLRAPLDG
jgi:hypothetical protein